MTFSRWNRASRRSEDCDKPSVEIFVAVSAVNVAMVAVMEGMLVWMRRFRRSSKEFMHSTLIRETKRQSEFLSFGFCLKS